MAEVTALLRAKTTTEARGATRVTRYARSVAAWVLMILAVGAKVALAGDSSSATGSASADLRLALVGWPTAFGLAAVLVIVLSVKYWQARHVLRASRARVRELEKHASMAHLQGVSGSPSVRDAATGLFTREHMEASLDREIRRAMRERVPVAVIILALEGLKHLRANVGNEAADLVLREVGTLLQKNIRGSDIACRYEEDEFAVVLLAASRPQALARVDVLRTAIAALNLRYQDQNLGPLTTSVGVAVHTEHGPTPNSQTVLKAAVAALFEARTWDDRDRRRR